MNFKNGRMKKAGIAFVCILVIIQFARPARNTGNDLTYDIATKYPLPATVQQILKVSCYDCHSNNTFYPWYTNIQPVGWWLQHHVNEGKQELNFSEFTTYSAWRRYHKLEETIEMIDENEMPLASYTAVHTNAKLSAGQKQMLTQWAKALLETMKATYPADSLRRPQRPRK